MKPPRLWPNLLYTNQCKKILMRNYWMIAPLQMPGYLQFRCSTQASVTSSMSVVVEEQLQATTKLIVRGSERQSTHLQIGCAISSKKKWTGEMLGWIASMKSTGREMALLPFQSFSHPPGRPGHPTVTSQVPTMAFPMSSSLRTRTREINLTQRSKQPPTPHSRTPNFQRNSDLSSRDGGCRA